MSKLTSTRRLALRIARQLFTAYGGVRATRIALKLKHGPLDHERDLGGWCEKAAVDQIDAVLQRSQKQPDRGARVSAKVVRD